MSWMSTAANFMLKLERRTEQSIGVLNLALSKSSRGSWGQYQNQKVRGYFKANPRTHSIMLFQTKGWSSESDVSLCSWVFQDYPTNTEDT